MWRTTSSHGVVGTVDPSVPVLACRLTTPALIKSAAHLCWPISEMCIIVLISWRWLEPWRGFCSPPVPRCGPVQISWAVRGRVVIL